MERQTSQPRDHDAQPGGQTPAQSAQEDAQPRQHPAPPASGAGGMIALPVVRLIQSFLRRGSAPATRGKQNKRLWPLLMLLLVLLVAGCGVPGTIAAGGKLPAVPSVPTAATLPPVHFPQDEAPHSDLTEWWYYTGHLHATDAQGQAHDYGFELTFFQTLRGKLPPYYAAHFAVTDLTRGQFHYDERAAFEPVSVIPPANSTNGFTLALGDWTMHGLNGHDQFAASMTNYALALTAQDELPHPVLHGGDGLIDFGAGSFSYYYSRPLLSVSGTLTDHGAPLAVTGTAWMDHQWGNFVTSGNGTSWDWFSIQLADRTEYMLYIIRDQNRKPIALVGTAVAPDGSTREIATSASDFAQLGTWTSPVTGGVYPSGWHITLPSSDVSLTLIPQLQDQELVTAKSTGVAYWEGTVRITGTSAGGPITGQGYVELTGYASIPASLQGIGTAQP